VGLLERDRRRLDVLSSCEEGNKAGVEADNDEDDLRCKALSTPATMSKRATTMLTEHCPMLQVERFFRFKVECCFDKVERLLRHCCWYMDGALEFVYGLPEAIGIVRG